MNYGQPLLLISYGHQAAHLALGLLLFFSIYWHQKINPSLRSLLLPLCAVGLGIIITREAPFFHIPIVASFLVAALALPQKKQALGLILLWHIIGALLFFVQYNEFKQLGAALFNKKLSLTGTISSSNHQAKNYVLCIHVTKVEEECDTKDSSFYIMLYTQTNTLRTGDHIRPCNTKLARASNNNDGSPCSFADYLTRTHCLCSCFSITKENIQIINRPNTFFPRWLEEKRKNIGLALSLLAPQTLSNFIQLIFLGNKNDHVPENMKIACQQWGITHYLARSGLHIALLILIWTYLFSLIPVHIFFKRLALLCMGITYHLLSYSSISFIRSLLLFLLATTGRALRLSICGIHLLFFVCLATITINPIQLFFLDFQLTFLLTFCLIAATSPFPNQDP